jgi:cell wall-associated NlpC family hydrolase
VSDLREIADRARSMMGTPFRHQGRQPGVGLDCLGLVVCSIGGRALDLDERDYAELPDGYRLRVALERYFEPLDVHHVEDAPSGAVLAFCQERDRSREPRHVGIRTDGGMIHSRRSGRSGVSETDLSTHWQRTFVGAYAWRA